MLKFMTSLYVIVTYPMCHEGQLTDKKTLLISNKYLYRRAIQLNLHNSIITNKYLNRRYLPFPYRFLQVAAEAVDMTRRISDKTVADVVEAIIGAYTIDSDWDLTQIWSLLSAKLNIVPDNGTAFPDISSLYSSNGRSSMNDDTTSTSMQDCDNNLEIVKSIERIIGYEFLNKSICIEATIHPSLNFENSFVSDCYQRLEFFGDAVLDIVVTRYLYEWCDPKLSPGQITDWRSYAVCNTTLARLCITNGLVKFLQHSSEALQQDIDLLCSNTLSHDSLDAPKAIGDFFEAVIGAVYIDRWNWSLVLLVQFILISGAGVVGAVFIDKWCWCCWCSFY